MPANSPSTIPAVLRNAPICWVLLQGALACAQPDTQTTVELYQPVTVTAAALPYRQFEKIEITGSSIVRKQELQTLPIQVVTRAEIQKSAKQNIADYLQSLPVLFNSFSPPMLGTIRSGFSGGAVHGQQVGTLVLINGRRLANYGRQTSFGGDNGGVDLNALPLSAIERVEILTDGASTIYGTDAQSGVINIITRTERPGVEITADQRMPDGQKGQGSRVDLSVGGGRMAQDGYSWFIAGDLQDQQELLGRDRPYAAAGRYLLQQGGQDYWVYGSALTAAQTAPTLATSKTAPYTRLWNADYQNGNCPDHQVPALGQPACLDNTYAAKGLYPALKAAKLHALGQVLLTPDLTAYAELSWKHDEQRRTYNSWPQYSAKIGNTPGAPGYDLAVANGFDPARGVWLLYSGSQLGPSSRWYETQTRRLVAGIKGIWQDWDFNTGYYLVDNYSSLSTEGISAYPNLGLNSSGVLTNPSLLSSLTPDSALALQLQGMVRPRAVASEGTNRQQGVDLRASRSVGELDGRDIWMALGTDWRQEVAQYSQYSSGIPSYEGQRKIWAQFAEMQLPLPNEVELLASLRNDHYSDFGNTTHSKLSAKWAPNSEWLVRGGWGTGFRAPAVAQMQETGKSQVSTAQIACNAAQQSVASQLGGTCPSNGVAVYSQGSSQLKPELSSQWNLGLRFSPDRNQTLSVDYWQLDMRNKISNYFYFLFSDPYRYKAYFELNAKKELQVFAPMMNLGRTQTSGIDFSWSLRRPVDWGQLYLGVNGTILLTSRYQQADGEPFVNDLNRFSDYSGYITPKLKTRWHLGLLQADWQWQATVNHVGSYNLNTEFSAYKADTGQAVVLNDYRVPAWWTADLMVIHQWSPTTSFRFGIENVFNRPAPFDISFSFSLNYGTNPMLANVWGRTAHASLTHRF